MLRVEKLTKYYDNLPAIKDVSFEVAQGEVVGLLGLNGAGKTTCLRILTGYLFPSSGQAFIGNKSVFSDSLHVKSQIGYLPEQPPLYPELSVRDYLHFVARLRGVSEEKFPEELERVSQLGKLSGTENSLIRSLSLGFRKRVGIAQALIGSPPALILDEPVSGLDPRQIVEMRKLIRDLAGEHTILISSHILTEVSRTCDRVLVLHDGRLKGEVRGAELQDNLEERFMELTNETLAEAAS